MWLCLQGLELGLAVAAAAGGTTTTTSSSSHSVRRSHDCCCLSHTSLNPSSSALQTGFAWRWRQRYHQGLATDCQRRDRCLEMCCCVVGGGSGGRASGQSRPQEAIRKVITTGLPSLSMSPLPFAPACEWPMLAASTDCLSLHVVEAWICAMKQQPCLSLSCAIKDQQKTVELIFRCWGIS
jgi:hypothetical protein